jgi:hypothetical protein
MIADGNLRQLRDHAREEVERAERAYWAYFIEFVKSDLVAAPRRDHHRAP